MEVTIRRIGTREGDKGLRGRLDVHDPGGTFFGCWTLELPWRDNQRNISCIPAGRYRATRESSSKGLRYRLHNVPGRSGVLIHAGNWAGDMNAGFKSDSRGCILIGCATKISGGQWMITDSRAALTAFEAVCRDKPITLTIEDP